MPELENPSEVDVAGCLCSNAIRAGQTIIYVFILLKVPHVSASAAEDKTLRIALHSVWIGLFLSG